MIKQGNEYFLQAVTCANVTEDYDGAGRVANPIAAGGAGNYYALWVPEAIGDFDRGAVYVNGVVEVPKALNTEVYGLLDAVYLNAGNTAASIASASSLLGVAVEPSTSGDTTVKVKIGGSRSA